MELTRAVNIPLRGSRATELEVEAKLRGMLLIRLVLAVAIFLSGPILFRAYAPPLYLFTGTLFFLTLLYVFLLKLRFEPQLFANVQIFADVFLVTLLIALTGWQNSNFGFLYIIPIITTSLFFQLRQSISIAVLSSILYAAVVLFHRYRLSPALRESSFEIFYSLYIRTIIFCMVGYLCGYLANLLKKQKEELRELKNLHQLILSSMSSGLITTDANNTIIYANGAAEKILGFPLDAMYNQKLGDFFMNRQGESFQAVPDRAPVTQADAENTELQARTADGRKIPVGFNLSSIIDISDQPVGKVMVFSDLTEVKELERRLRAIDKFRTAGELAAGIAHEIRNPLTSISGSIEMLAESPELSETDRELLSVMFKESTRLNKIIEDFLTYARRGNLDMKKENLSEMIRESIEMLGRGGKLTSDIRIELVAPSQPAIVAADKSQMSQVFLNLLTNAVDAMHGSGTIYIKIERPTRKNDDYSVTITDTGHGMTVQKLSRVFEPFFTTKKNGGGIGLCIAERIVREHNGHIQIVSQEGKGTSATVVIPGEQGVRHASREAPQPGRRGRWPGFMEPGPALSETVSQDPKSAPPGS